MENGEAKSVRRSRDACASWIVYRRTRTCKLVRIGFWKGISRISPPSPPTHAPPPPDVHTRCRCKVFPAEFTGPGIQQIGDTSCPFCFCFCSPPSHSTTLPSIRDTGESFIDEIVNTPDRRMFCRPLGRLSVAIGDHPMRPRLLDTVQKGLKLVANRSLSLPHYLNLTFSFLIRLPLRLSSPHFLRFIPFLRSNENSTIDCTYLSPRANFKLVVRLHANDSRSTDPFRE